MRRPLPSPSVCLAVALVFAVGASLPTLIDASQRSSRERTMYVSAVDSAGAPVAGLGPEAFVIREDGVRREVLRVSRAAGPIDVAVLVDNTAAVANELTLVRSGLAKFVARMAPGNRVAIIALADRPTIFVDYTSDPARLADGVGRVFPMSESGMTLLDAIVETSQGLSRRETPRAVIVPVITDGIEYTNRYFRDVVRTLVTSRIALHAVTIGQFRHSEEHGIRERSFLLDAAPKESGGQRVALLTAHGLDGALQRVAEELLSQYAVVYSRPESLIPPERTEVASGRPGLTVRGTPARGE